MLYTGLIIKNSLKNPEILEEFRVLKTEFYDDWEIVLVEVAESDLEKISDNLNGSNWYADFAGGETGVVIFQNKLFKMNTKDKTTWVPAIEYGKSIGIPKEQLDFSFKY